MQFFQAQAGLPSLPVRLPGIDVVRALAASAVMVSHILSATLVWAPNAPLSHRAAEELLTCSFSFGTWGVGLFFVLSGLCIHLPIARRAAAHDGGSPWTVDVKGFYRRRFARIYLPHLVALLLSATIAAVVPHVLAADECSLSVPSVRQLVLHVLMLHTFSPTAFFSVNPVLWTIAVETHFYILYPVLLWARRRFPMHTICLALFGLAMAFRVGSHLVIPGASPVPTLVAQNFVCRWWEWALGCYVAERLIDAKSPSWVPRTNTLAMLIGSLGLAILIRHLPHGITLGTVVLPPLYAVVLYYAARQFTSEQSIFDRSIITLGRESYSLYLTHTIAMAIGVAAAVSLGMPWPVSTILNLFAALLLSRIIFVVVEQPCLRQAATIRVYAQPAASPVAEVTSVTA